MTPDALERAPTSLGAEAVRVVAVVSDLFFVARIRETARAAGVPLEFARTPEALETALTTPARFALVDLTGPVDHARVFASLEAAGVPALGFTTHALARATRPWHPRCARVVTKEALTRALAAFLLGGPVAAVAGETDAAAGDAPEGSTERGAP